MPTAETAASEASATTSLTSLILDSALQASSPISPEALSTKEVSSYIRSLSSFSLSDLRAQPQQLQSKSEALHRQVSELCISQTDAFIHIHQAEQQFSPSLSTLATHLSDLINHTLPDLQKAADAFAAASQPVLTDRERIQNLADQYERGNLSDLLETPPLVQTCVRAGHHSEAIQLAEHLIGLLTRSAKDVPQTNGDSVEDTRVGQHSTYLSLLTEILSHLANMKADLISSFSKTGLRLPAARKFVSVLRKLNHLQSLLPQIPSWTAIQSQALIPELGLTENQLCLAFLKSRIRSFHSALDAMGSPSSFSSEAYLRRYIDLWREEMADTLSMAFSLFIDEPNTSQEVGMVDPAYLVSSFATSGLERLRETVSAQLVAASQIPSSGADGGLETLAETYNNVHTQLSYASASLARFGFDFGKILFPGSLSTIEGAWLEALSHSLDEAFASMHEQMDQHSSTLPSAWLISPSLTPPALEDLYTVTSKGSDSNYDDCSRPNIELVDYPPLAKLLNRLLEWINALQVFAPTSLSRPLLDQLDTHFGRISNRLLTQMPELISLSKPDAPHANRLLADDEAQSLLHHLDSEERATLALDLVKDRETAILGKVLKMWQASVVSWTLRVVGTQIFDQAEVEGVSEAEEAWTKAKGWIRESEERIADSNKQRKVDAEGRKRAADEAEAAKVKAEAEVEEARRKKEEEERLRAEQEAKRRAEEEAKRRAEEEARQRAEEEARRKAEEEARQKAEEARLKADEEARRKAEEEARMKAEEEARKIEEEEARLKAEEEVRQKAEEEARLKAEEKARLKAQEKARQDAEEKARKEAEDEARRKAEAETRLMAEEEAQRKAEEEARQKAEEEARQKQEAEAQAQATAAEEARSKAEAEAEATAKAKAKAEEEAQIEAEAQAATARQEEEEARKTAEEDAAKARAADEATAKEQEEATAQTKAEDEAAAEPQAAEEPSKTAEEKNAAPSAASSKKFSLAEKLRQRKEERDRAATAAAAAEASGSKVEEPAAGVTETTASVQEPPSSANDSAQVESVEESKGEEGKEEAPKPDNVVEDKEEAKGEEAEDDADDDEEAVEGEASGDTAATTPNTPTLDGGGGGGKKKKKNKKKKK